MTQRARLSGFFGLFMLTFLFAHPVRAAELPEVEKVFQKGFPTQQDALAKTTDALRLEYKNTGNISALVFYSYGLLRQANHFLAVNDFIHASEYSKLGFFYLDEAVEGHEDDPRVRYLRARIDSWLPASIGRCVVTLHDTEEMLKKAAVFDQSIVNYISYMRYRALYSCKKYQQASELLAQLKQQGVTYPGHLEPGFDTAPVWEMSEVTQVLLPLVKGD